MNAEFFDAIAMIEKEKGIPRTYMHEKIVQALTAAFKRDNQGVSDNVFVELDDDRKEVRMYQQKYVVEDVENPVFEMTVAQAREISPGADVGDTVNIEIPTKNFGRIAAQTAKGVIIQGIREAERGMVYEEYSSREHEVLSAQVLRSDPRTGTLMVEITSGGETREASIPSGEQIRDEVLEAGDRIKVYVIEVRRTHRGPQMVLSRTHPGLVKRLFELEVPEIHDETIEIRSIAREAGQRTKIAVWSKDENVDPVGACIGVQRSRIDAVTSELGSEKIDLIKYSEDPAEFIAKALAPADVIGVEEVDPRSCRVIVPDDQLSLAIGKEGQNARLAAKLTGFRIDIKPESRSAATSAKE
ncbi:MAG: transcription termination factor NusA [Oscillospiraceae bacterium]|nr:transcription termination factor NusA [Oscillospiraceae bacterium]